MQGISCQWKDAQLGTSGMQINEKIGLANLIAQRAGKLLRRIAVWRSWEDAGKVDVICTASIASLVCRLIGNRNQRDAAA